MVDTAFLIEFDCSRIPLLLCMVARDVVTVCTR